MTAIGYGFLFSVQAVATSFGSEKRNPYFPSPSDDD
jgi:hypothetical protein